MLNVLNNKVDFGTRLLEASGTDLEIGGAVELCGKTSSDMTKLDVAEQAARFVHTKSVKVGEALEVGGRDDSF